MNSPFVSLPIHTIRARMALAISILSAALVLSLSPAALAQSGAEQAAEAQVRQLLASAQANSSSVNGVAGVVRSHFAVGTWANALLGKQKKKFSSGQNSEFRSLLPRYLGKLYVNQFGRRQGPNPEITRVRTVRGDVLVTARLSTGSGRVPVVWRMRAIGGKYRVIDYSVGGVSNLVLKRAEFTSKVKQSGPDSLNQFLRTFISS
ncbi:MAG: ABC transporter substrate-binding protein [Pseudomonadota bacterium]